MFSFLVVISPFKEYSSIVVFFVVAIIPTYKYLFIILFLFFLDKFSVFND